MRRSATQELAGNLAELRFNRLPREAADKTAECMLDFFAAAWNGAAHPLYAEYRALARELGGREGYACIFGGGVTVPYWAAFANAACGHFTEVDDTHKKASMHIGAIVFPVVLALAPEFCLDGERIVECVVAGYEAAARTGMAFGKTHAALFHSTGTAGSFGAAAAAAKVIGLDAAGTADALGHAGTQAMALWQFLADGALSAKAFHPARAVQNGIAAAFLARRGIAGASRILEGEKGYFARFVEEPVIEAMTRDFGRPYMVMEAGFKTYPVCGQIHAPLDAMRGILTANPELVGNVAAIDSIEVATFGQALNLTDKRAADTLAAAKFSTQTCIAFLTVHGVLGFDTYEEGRIFTPEVQALRERVFMRHDPEMEKEYPAGRPCRVIVRLADGRVIQAGRLHRSGDPECPMTREELAAKFIQLSGALLPRHRQEWILDWIYHLPEQEALSPELFRPAANQGRLPLA